MNPRGLRLHTLKATTAVEVTVPAPHPPLEAYYASERDRSAWVRGIFDRTAADYDRLERILGLGTGSWYRERSLRQAGLAPRMSVIDVGTGTGLLAAAAVRIVADPLLVTGVDPSPGMIGHARVPTGVRLLAGSAESIPAADGSADFLCLGYALRHISDLTAAFAEFHRVLRPGGRLCLLEITRPSGTLTRAFLKAWLDGVVPAIAAVVARRESAQLMHYYWDTIDACAPPATILAALVTAGFGGAERQVELGIFSAYRARKPAASHGELNAP
jgi:demethylmenaquinone methyltransferase / 2-methoxy-6-polyprenyl-1,4-benzoquinol methylase